MSMHSPSFVNPPLDGSITLPEAIEFHWQHNADLPIYVFHEEGKDTSDITEITCLEFGRACHRVATIVNRTFPSVTERPVVAVMAFTDSLFYQAISLGLMKSGFIPFPISPRNTPGAIIQLLTKTSCHRLLATRTTLKDLLDSVKIKLEVTNSSYELMIEEPPSLRDIFPRLGVETEDDPFTPFRTEYKPNLDEIAMYVHSSGSTGLPKAIPPKHQTLIHWISVSLATPFRNHTPRLRMATMHLPPFHGLGTYCQIIWPLLGGVTTAIYPPIVESPECLPTLATAENILDNIQRTASNALITTPAFLQTWAQDRRAVELLSTLQCLLYCGGPVAFEIGDSLVASGVKLSPIYGATECGLITLPFKRKGDEGDWVYLEFSDKAKVRWVPQGDGTYECQSLATATHHLAVENLEDVRGYATSDLFQPHPTKDYLWKIVGRVDDVVIHSSGEKTVPGPMEDIIMSSPHLIGAIIFGRAHDQAGLLVEPKSTYAINVKDEAEVARFRNLIWPIVEDANSVAPAFSKLFKEMILITSKEKPLPRAAKGTVLRKLSLEIYNDEIEALYATVESTERTESTEPPQTWDSENVSQWLIAQIEDLKPGKKITPSYDLFEHGFDSLTATILRRRITGALQSLKLSEGASATKPFNQSTLYTYPTVELLTSFLVDIVSRPPGTRIVDRSPVTAIEEMIERYSFPKKSHAKFSAIPLESESRAAQNVAVLLTGSTGNLGSQILEKLLLNPNIHRVYTHNRASTSSKSQLDRHLDRFRDKGLDSGTLESKKWAPLEGDLATKNLGLSDAIYHELRDSVTVIIHVSWRLDFNLSLQSFESNIRGTYNLIDLGHATGRASTVKFVFTSSAGSALSWDQSRGPYPEEVVMDPQYAVGNGYGESKYVAERTLHTSDLNATSLRIGQITGGPPNGAWATTDWFPILVKSSLELGALPTAHGVVSWIPMDSVAQSVMDLVFSVDTLPPAINIVHSNPVTWNSVIQNVADALVQQLHLPAPLPLVSFQEWFSLLKNHGSSLDEANQVKIPALKLRNFFERLARADVAISSGMTPLSLQAGGGCDFSIEEAEAMSPARRGLQPLSKQDAERWVAYWKGAGLFH
ncbi:hypothetical protein M413DRAFT_31301 [Hebeloma cylindrosporum]|uniref:Carrier domain-containing protein n=1 Tax=Hebeloma cylindrosporum TaxID=76867 RepID=A0A0C3BXX1_HEBCY|nr:hypothetical protein M413DRAFT_31301 [Hebeloma cylindrosporum h7]